jgi:hypothetical protein
MRERLNSTETFHTVSRFLYRMLEQSFSLQARHKTLVQSMKDIHSRVSNLVHPITIISFRFVDVASIDQLLTRFDWICRLGIQMHCTSRSVLVLDAAARDLTTS